MTVPSGKSLPLGDSENSEQRAPDAAGTPARRRRFEPAMVPGEGRRIVQTVLTPIRTRMLRHLATQEPLGIYHLASLMGIGEKQAARHMRILFDARLLRLLPVGRAALAPIDADLSPELFYGSAPGICVLTPEGREALHGMGLIPARERARPAPEFGARALFLAHTLEVGDVYAWATGISREIPGAQLLSWRSGPRAAIAVGSGRQSRVLPDARFALEMPCGMISQRDGETHIPSPLVISAAVEVDRASERAMGERWKQKLLTYEKLLASDRVKELTGYNAIRILVIVPTVQRRSLLADMIAAASITGVPNTTALQGRFWIAARQDFVRSTLTSAIWQTPGSSMLRPLLPPRATAGDGKGVIRRGN